VTLIGVLLSIGVTVGFGVQGAWWLRAGVGIFATALLIAASRSLATLAAIEGFQRTEEKVFLLLWHVAERCGRVENGHVRVEIALTHEQIARWWARAVRP